jgi:hypothetical protein
LVTVVSRKYREEERFEVLSNNEHSTDIKT